MTEAASTAAKIRVDKWLWHARFFKSRGLAGDLAGSGALRVNGERIAKPAHAVRAGDVLTFPQGGRIRVIRVRELGARRGPASEAQGLYDDLDPPGRRPPAAGAEERAAAGAGDRPDKRQRRQIIGLRRGGP